MTVTQPFDTLFAGVNRCFISRLPPKTHDRFLGFVLQPWQLFLAILAGWRPEAIDRLISLGEDALRRAKHSCLEHYHTEQNLQGLDHTLIKPGPEVGEVEGEIVFDERLGGLLKYYRRRIA